MDSLPSIGTPMGGGARYNLLGVTQVPQIHDMFHVFWHLLFGKKKLLLLPKSATFWRQSAKFDEKQPPPLGAGKKTRFCIFLCMFFQLSTLNPSSLLRHHCVKRVPKKTSHCGRPDLVGMASFAEFFSAFKALALH